MSASNSVRVLQMALLSGLTSMALATGALAQSQATDHTAHHPAGPEKSNAAESAAQADPSKESAADGKGMMKGDMMKGMGCGMSGPVSDERLATLHDSLKITPAQEHKWAAFAGSLRNARQSMSGMGEIMHGDGKAALPERIGRHVVAMETHLNAVKQVQATAAHLYGVLSSEQKAAVDDAFRGMGMM